MGLSYTHHLYIFIFFWGFCNVLFNHNKYLPIQIYYLILCKIEDSLGLAGGIPFPAKVGLVARDLLHAFKLSQVIPHTFYARAKHFSITSTNHVNVCCWRNYHDRIIDPYVCFVIHLSSRYKHSSFFFFSQHLNKLHRPSLVSVLTYLISAKWFL